MRAFYTFLFIAIPSVIFAQANYHAGYVLKNNGDTLKGYIDYREWAQSPTAIDFKVNVNNDQVLSFNPQTIKKFEITGMETYVSYAGNITMNKNHFPDLAQGPDTVTVHSFIFLKPITTGRHITLFFQNDAIKTRFFIAEGNDKPVELKYYQYYSDKGDVVERALYRGQLILLINKYNNANPKLLRELELLNYEQTELEDMVDKINQNVTSLRIDSISTRTRKASSRWFIGGGGILTKTSSNGPNVSAPFSPELHAGLDLFTNRNVQQVILRAEVSGYSESDSFQYPSSTYPQTYSTSSFSRFTISITPQVILNVFNTDKLKIYVDGGVDVNVSVYSNVPSSGFRNPWFALRTQAGVVFNKRLEFSIDANPMPIAGYNESFGLGFSYLLDNN